MRPASSRLDEHTEEQRRLSSNSTPRRTSVVSDDGDETSPLSLRLDESAESSDSASHSPILSTTVPWVASPMVVRPNGSQNSGLCRCVDPRWWSRAMLLSAIAVVALAILDIHFIYRQHTDGGPFRSTLVWASFGFSLALCVCCGLCVVTHGGTGMISLILRDKRMMHERMDR